MANKKKLLKGLKNIHFAPFVNGAFETPVRIDNAKSIEASLKYESDQTWAEDMMIADEYEYAGGEGKMSILGLSKEEYETLFGAKVVKGGIVASTNDRSADGAFLFERGKKGSSAKRLYTIYACKCSPAGISAEGIEEGKGEVGVDEIEFSIGSMDNGDIYHFIDTDDSTVSTEAITAWYQEVQMPIEISASLKIKK